jgi:hypothetical protein
MQMGWADTLIAAADSLDGIELDESTLGFVQSANNSFRGLRGSGWLLKEATRACDPLDETFCQMENMRIIALAAALSSSLVILLCIFAFIREDKEENITPLCPQLVVKDQDLRFEMESFADTGPGANGSYEDFQVVDQAQEVMCRCSWNFLTPLVQAQPTGLRRRCVSKTSRTAPWRQLLPGTSLSLVKVSPCAALAVRSLAL